MAATLVNRAAQNQSIGSLRFSFNFLSDFSTAALTQNPGAASASKKPKRKKNFFEVAQFLPNWGLGYHMAKTHWTDVSYQITKINLYKVFRLQILPKSLVEFTNAVGDTFHICANLEIAIPLQP